MRPLPVLDEIKVASPCSARWDEMIGDARVRFCAHCEKNVYNLSAMTREEAQALLVEKEGNLCARFYRRADGSTLTADCPVGVRRKRVRRIAAVAAGAGALAALGTGFGGASRVPHYQGELAATVPTPPATTAPTTTTTREAPTAVPSETGHVMMGAVAMPMNPPPPPKKH
jgi:hypothetical protein